MSDSVLSRRSRKAVLRNQKPSRNIDSEEYSHSLLILLTKMHITI